MNAYAIYLRKSRADMDAEARGEGETLAKHRKALTEYARQRGLIVVREYAEIVSGDSISARPQMQALLEDVKRGLYAGVIVNDVDRLGRGDSIDQEIIKLTFAASHTLIITPYSDIDPTSIQDGDMLDFRMFFARTEYKMITRRMTQGRARSAASGNWVSGLAPYGYRIAKHDGIIRLEPDPETAPIVKMIFAWYANAEAGYQLIAKRLNEMGIKSSRNRGFSPHVIHRMLENPAYIGRTEYGQHATVETIESGQRVKKYVKSKPQIVLENTHPAIVTPEIWKAVRERAELARHRSPINTNKVSANPLAGLVICSECGSVMQMTRSAKRMISCLNTKCPTCSISIDTLEGIILDTLRSWCERYKMPQTPSNDKADEIAALRKQLDGISAQITRAQELVEMGVYSPTEYMTRKEALQSRREALKIQITELSRKTPEEAREAILPDVERVIDAYPYAQTAEQKNRLLKSIIHHITYHKTQRAWRGQNPTQHLRLDVFPLIRDSI